MPDVPPFQSNSSPPATISYATVPITDSKAAYVDDDSDPGLFDFYTVVNHYEKDRRVWAAGVTTPAGWGGATTAFVQTSNPVLLWICEWTAKKVQNQPQLPDPNNADSNWVLLDEYYAPEEMSLMADGVTPVYTIRGYFVYAHKNPNAKTYRNIAYPRAPWMVDQFNRTQPDNKFQQGISTPALRNLGFFTGG